MNKIVIDLTSQVTAHNPQAGNGREVLREVYFRITVPYYEKAMYDYSPATQAKEHEAVSTFYHEIVELLEKNGWHQMNEDWKNMGGTCPELKKGNARLYCHPQSISGEVAADDIATLEAVFKAATSFEHYKTDDYRDVIVTTSADDEMDLYAETHDATIMQRLQEATTTKRRNLYKQRTTVEHYMKRLLNIDTIRTDVKVTTIPASWKYAANKIDEAIAAGTIITADNGRLIRWISKHDKKTVS